MVFEWFCVSLSFQNKMQKLPMYAGATTKKAPPANPTRKRPKYKLNTPGGHTTNAHPTINGTINRIIVLFRPKKSMTKPMIRQLNIPPTVASDPIHENCSSVTGNPYALCLMISNSAGELHPNTQPAANAPDVANH